MQIILNFNVITVEDVHSQCLIYVTTLPKVKPGSRQSYESSVSIHLGLVSNHM